MKRHIAKFLIFIFLSSINVEADCCKNITYTKPPPPIRPCCCSDDCYSEPPRTYDPYCYACDQFCPGECHFFFGAEGLWWTACENDLDFAVDFNTEQTEILGIGNTHFASYDWDWGVRGWLGWNWCCGWDTVISYTWFKTEGNQFIDTTDEDISLKASLLYPNTGLSDADTATAKLDLKYQALDVLFGRTIVYCEDTVQLHPFFGFHGIWLKHDQSYLYEGGDFGTGSLAAPARVTWNSTLKGAGLIGGADVNLKWPCGIGIFGSMGGSILASKTDIEHLQEILDISGNITSTDIDLKEDQCVCIPGLHLKTGLSFQFACGQCLLMKFHLMYEFSNYFNTPHLRRYSYHNEGVSSSSASGNTALQGITVGGEIFF